MLLLLWFCRRSGCSNATDSRADVFGDLLRRPPAIVAAILADQSKAISVSSSGSPVQIVAEAVSTGQRFWIKVTGKAQSSKSRSASSYALMRLNSVYRHQAGSESERSRTSQAPLSVLVNLAPQCSLSPVACTPTPYELPS